MPAITVSAVNTGTEELTATAHGLNTGDRFRLRNVGGALPAATPALAAVTDYFAIRTGVNTIKVAVSNPDALAGTAVNITGSGSGTTTVEYGLPYCVPRIAAPLGQVHSADLNAEWQTLVSLYDLLTGQSQGIWSKVSLAIALNAAVAIEADGGIDVGTNQSVKVHGTGRFKHDAQELNIDISHWQVSIDNSAYIAYVAAGYYTGFAAVCDVRCWIPLITGKRILNWIQYYNINGTAATLSGQLRRINLATGVITDVASLVNDNTGTGIESQNIAVNHTMLSGEAYYISITAQNPGHRVHGATILFDDP